MNPWALTVGALLLSGLTIADVLLSPAYLRQVRAAVADGDPRARTGMYRLTIALAWSAAACALVLMVAGGLSLQQIGLRFPSESGLKRWGGVLVGAGVGTAVLILLTRAGRMPTRALGDIDVLLPRGRPERRWFTAVSVTAGITEEIVYRALALIVLQAVLPGGQVVALVTAAAVFGLGHLYQGWVGALYTAALALLLGKIYLDMGSLLPVMAVHAAVDLRALLLEPGDGATT